MPSTTNVAAITVISNVQAASAGVFGPFESYLTLTVNAYNQAQAAADDALESQNEAEAAAAAALLSEYAAEQAANDARMAAEVSGAVEIFDTYFDADAALPDLSEDDVVEVLVDETRKNKRTRYRVASGALVFKIYLLTANAAMLDVSGVLQGDTVIESGCRKIAIDLEVPDGFTLTIEDDATLVVL